MPRQPRAVPADTSTAGASLDSFGVITSLIERLADGPLDERAVALFLEALRAGLQLEECVLWRAADDGAMVRAAGAGTERLTRDDLPTPYGAAAQPAGDVALAPVQAGRRTLGVLVGRGGSPPGGEAEMVLRAAARLLGPALAAADQARRAADDLAARTRQIEDQRRFIERIVDSLPVGLYVVDKQYRVQAWNRKRETGMQGVLREEAIGRTIFEILRRQPADLLRQEFDEVFQSGVMTQFEMHSSATGEPRTYRVSKIPMRVHDAAVTHVITIGEDITDWKRAHEKIAEAQRLAALGQLSAGVMHEINNPLATIAACNESMALRLDEPDVPPPLREAMTEYTQIIEHEVHRCKRIVDGLLDFSRPRGDAREPVDPNEVVEHTLFLLKHHPRFKHVRVEASLEADADPPVVGSREQLAQVLMALLLNASDAMDGTGRVVIRSRTETEGERSGVVIEVEDQGRGIPPADLGRLFEPFYTTKAPGRGTGLGLSICYGIVADHGGRIDVESQMGVGSTFRVHLPAARRP